MSDIRPHVTELPGGEVHVGRAVEVTHAERRVLEECARMMMSSANRGRAGWLLVYLRGHKEAHKVIREIMLRAQTQT